MAWPLVIAAVTAVAGVFNALDEYIANRKIRDDLEEIKKYLSEIQGGIEFIKNQNLLILKRLDELPVEIRRIVLEVVSDVVLSGRYSEIGNIRDNYLELLNKKGKNKGYGIRDSEWLIYSAAMTYIFENEGKVSKTFDLINICEIALIITKERVLNFVILRISQRIAAMDGMYLDLSNYIESKIQKTIIDLNQIIYIKSHNLSENLDSIDNFVLVPQPNRNITVGYMNRECVHKSSRYVDDYIVCSDVLRYHDVPDTAFHNARDNFVASIGAQINEIKLLLTDLGGLSDARASLNKYLEKLDSDTTILEFPRVMYFIAENTKSRLSETDRRANVLNEKDFDDYFDGCRGVCEDKQNVVEDENISFFKVPC